MALTPGTRLGPYEILSALGAGGMGEVYRAHDAKLNRDVAIKVLLPAVAHDPDRLARFSREAQVLASLNHPNIAHIHGIEETDGVTALVLELVEGEDLAQRIARGPIPLDEALPIARQIADALDAAHEQGIIHRDLKPANIKVRDDGTVKVLDFGLAKALDPAGASSANAMMSPTLSMHATQAGIILGTAAYMGPEQAKGKPVDARADIWAFGAVLYEMLTGTRAFPGEDISDTMVAVLSKDPDWTRLSRGTPARVRELLRRCLERDAKRRLQAIGEARVQIEDVLAGAPEDRDAIATADVTPLWRRMLPWASTALFAMALAAVLVLWTPWRKVSPAPLLRLSAELGADVSLTFAAGDAVSLSPDGAVLAFVAQKTEGRPQLYVRRLTQLQATSLAGTDDAESPFFSPDGQWIGFFAGGKLKKIAATGGAVVIVCDAPNGRGGAWSEDNTIVFAPDAAPETSVMRVSSAGGAVDPLTSLAEGEHNQRWPQVLPGGKAVLFTTASGGIGLSNLVVQRLPAGARTIVQRGGSHGRYLPSGHLVYLRDGTLFAQPFDVDRLVVTGPPVPALEGVTSNAGSGGAQFAVSSSETLVYLPGQSISGVPILWMDRDGKTAPLRATPANWANLLFAPDGRRLAFSIFEGQTHIWIDEWERDTLTRLTSDANLEAKPVWTPDGRRLVFSSSRADQTTLNLYWQQADGRSGDAQRLTASTHPQLAASWHPSGKLLAYEEVNPTTNSDLMILPMEGDETSGWTPGRPTVFLNSPSQEHEPMFSPDGRWLAYSSDESGRYEVYVRPFPGPGGKSSISTSGGVLPTWSRTKRELLYTTLNGQIMVAPYASERDVFRAEKPRLWSDSRMLMRGSAARGNARMFDLHPDRELVAVAPMGQAGDVKQDKVVFLFNFFDELRRIAPVVQR